MAHRCLRPLLALGIVLAAASPGLVAGSAAAAPDSEAPEFVGNCWSYTPAFLAEVGDLSDATAVAPSGSWASDVELALTTAGATSVGGVRAFDLVGPGSLGDEPPLVGPMIEAAGVETEGVAHYFFSSSVDGAEPVAVENAVEVEFVLAADQVILPLGFTDGVQGEVTLTSPGDVNLTLEQVVFELDGQSDLIVCNGQEAGDAADPTSENPVNSPLPINVMTDFPVVAEPVVSIDEIENQRVTTAARGGDAATVSWAGLATDGQVKAELCGVSFLSQCVELIAEEPAASGSQGEGTASYQLPADAEAGEQEIRVTELPPVEADDEVEADEETLKPKLAALGLTADPIVVRASLQMLGEPTVSLASGSTSAAVNFTGAEWDPKAEVQVSLHGTSAEDGALASQAFVADDEGAIAGTISSDGDTAVTKIHATQVHGSTALMATFEVDLAAVTPPPPTDPGDDTPPVDDPPADDPVDNTTNTNTTATPSAPTVTAPAAAPEADIPATEALPVSEVTAPSEQTALPAEIAVTEAELIGSTRASDLFGGAPERLLRLRVENVGEAAVVAPGLEIAVGKDSPEPVFISDGVGRIEPGEVVTIEVPITLPVGAHGTYNITGRVGTGASGEFALTWETWPWGLFGLNALGALLVAWAIRRRFMRPAPALISAAAGLADPQVGVNDGEAVIDLATLEQWWALQAASVGEAADAVVDEAAVERWLDRCEARELTK